MGALVRPPIRTDLSAEFVRSILSYDPESGLFTRLAGPFAGAAGATNGNGYRLLSIQYRKYRAHRIAWLWMTGAWPTGEIDHINGVRDDNRWINLRDVPMVVNQQNRRSAMKTNRLGIQGVKFNPKTGKFTTAISVGKKGTHLGSFDCPQEARAKYVETKRELHKGFTL